MVKMIMLLFKDLKNLSFDGTWDFRGKFHDYFHFDFFLRSCRRRNLFVLIDECGF